eukprot:NODE_24899_length_606_cov_6.590814.p3 GENE.NODE_24899_length_606_cov_6.590814~~NODE_24899_length_606_cov_6.590814.p3  ORF type:complete len:71 (+),score=6.57 NODE_24899_length_606_cov_6.590814:261-473(+)
MLREDGANAPSMQPTLPLAQPPLTLRGPLLCTRYPYGRRRPPQPPRVLEAALVPFAATCRRASREESSIP